MIAAQVGARLPGAQKFMWRSGGVSRVVGERGEGRAWEPFALAAGRVVGESGGLPYSSTTPVT